ncbi:MAG TPA: hypothetical protein VFI70_01895 [Nitrososphaeraceae archaeon]|nr:hypothetical protein [Nitrososphaeraceae archaeon]
MLPTQNYNGLQFQQPSSSSSLATINIPNSIDVIEAVTENISSSSYRSKGKS